MSGNSRLLRAGGLRIALALELFTLAYMSFEAAAALGIGIVTSSVSLQSFGLDSLIEMASALVLIRRLTAESRGATDEQLETVERRAEQLSGLLLLALAAYIVFQSAYTLYVRQQPESSLWGIALALASLIMMPALARLKLLYAMRIGSRALRADAYESIACAYLALALLLGLGANYLFGWWWADPLAALGMVYFILKEAREALAGEPSEREN